jgi:hypothetical protein
VIGKLRLVESGIEEEDRRGRIRRKFLPIKVGDHRGEVR